MSRLAGISKTVQMNRFLEKIGVEKYISSDSGEEEGALAGVNGLQGKLQPIQVPDLLVDNGHSSD
ncbi:MAG: hypothetical protein A2293_01835 [Elusimicrobia bacterium RIFOXYB2_FULL_49_7]|nr:MAG: hypothetical protein A2293_01835 [Elusimicrobia bacterium RIFOXYB2_FULL_49_7]